MSANILLRWRLPPSVRWSPPQPPLQAVAAIIGPRGPAGILYAETIGDGVSSSFAINHGLGTKDLLVNTYAMAGNQPDIIPDVYRPSDDQIRIEFLDPPGVGEFRVVVVGVA